VPRRRARRILLALLLLAAGIFINIAVIVALSYRPWQNPLKQTGYMTPRGQSVATISIVQVRQFGALRRAITTFDDSIAHWSWNLASIPSSFRSEIGADADFDISWGMLRLALSDPTRAVIACEDARGWPLLACYASSDTSETNEPHVIGGIDIDVNAWGAPVHRILPLTPIPAGFALNSLLYAALLLPVAVLPPRLRRHLRRRRGHCPRCNYDLRAAPDDPCPECGQPPDALGRLR
jgi:hypothetical protein